MNCLPCLRGKNSEEKKSDDQQKDDKKDSEEEELPQELPVAQPKENPLSKQPSVKNGASLKNVKSVKKTKSVVTTADLKKKDEDSDDEGDGGSDTAAPALAPVAVSNAATATTNIATTTTDEPPTGSARTFKFRDLASATKNFKRECLLGESGFGRVYKGTLDDGKVVAVKQLDKIGTKANKEFIEEVMKLSDLHHPNLVELIGYCADGDQRLLVYEHMPRGSVKDHLHDLPSGKKPLDWITRMKAAAGAAQAMEYLHEKVKPPVLCRNVKSTNILLDENFEPKVTDYGLVNLESSSGSSVQQRVVGTVGCAPEYEYTGELTLKSDVYSFGVILLELITGRKAMDTSRPKDEQNLVSWAQPYFKDPKRFQELADPMFKGVIPEKNLNQAVGVAAMCLQEESGVRPLISDIVGALNFLTIAPPEGFTPSPAPAEPISGPPKQYSSLSSSSSSSESDSERELGIHIEPFNRPVMPEPMDEPKPKPESDSESESEPEPEPEVEWEQKHEWESDSETEPEPEPEPQPEPEPDFTDSDSDSDSDSDQEPVSKPEPVIQPVYKLEPVVEPQELSSHNDQPDSDNDSISSSGSIYEEDAYSEEEFSDEEKPSTSILINSKSKARMRVKSSKKRVMFKTEGTDSIKPVKKSFTKSRDDQKSPRYKKPPLHSNTKNMRKPDSRGDDNSDIEFTDESESDEEFGTQRFKSTISRFTAESRTYSAYQDENDHDSSSESEE